MAFRDSGGVFAPGSYNFKKVYLRDHDIDIRFKVLEINIYESIFQPCMTADITILDAENMVANYPIIEGNVVDIHLSFDEDDKIQQNIDNAEIKCAMEVVKITERIKTQNQDTQVYNLRLSSIGWSNNMRTRVSRSYNKKKYSDVVKDIFNSKFITPGMYGLSGNYSEFTDKDAKAVLVVPGYMPSKQFIVTINFMDDEKLWKNKDRKNGDIYKALKKYYIEKGIIKK